MPSEDIKAIKQLTSQLKSLKSQMSPSQVEALNKGGGRAREAASRNIGSSQPMKFLRANMTSEVNRAKRIVNKVPKGGGGASLIMNFMSTPQASKAATTQGKMPKKLRGKVKGAKRKA